MHKTGVYVSRRLPRGKPLRVLQRTAHGMRVVANYDSVSHALSIMPYLKKSDITPSQSQPRRQHGTYFFEYAQQGVIPGEVFRRFTSVDPRTRRIYFCDISNMGRRRPDKGGRIMSNNENCTDDDYRRFICGGRQFFVHRVVAGLFLDTELRALMKSSGLDVDALQVDHINGIKADNRVENLQWVTPAQHGAIGAQRSKLKRKAIEVDETYGMRRKVMKH